MLRTGLCLLLLCSLIFSCQTKKFPYAKIINRDSLPSQFLTIDNSRDTLIKTFNGALIKISKGSFSSDQVKLEVKEAYSPEQMILAGLTTESDGRPLRSGGMIYVNSVERNIALNKPISISIPTNFYDNRMKLYKGQEQDGKLNWIDPQPLAGDSLPPYLETGKRIFQSNCASCHSLDRDKTGPAMSGVEGRGPWNSRERLFYFTRNPAAFMARDCYTRQLKAKFGAMMTPFPSLDDQSLNAIYDYIKNEDMKKGIMYSTNYSPSCDDSCFRYDSLLRKLNGDNSLRDSLIADNGERINFEREFSTPLSPGDSDYIPDTLVKPVDKVEPIPYQSIYYQFNINTLDWYNVDRLVDETGAQTELKVETTGQFKNNMSVFIVIPEQRVFAEGGPLRGETNVYGFYTQDGKIALPMGTKVIVFALGESGGRILFDYKKFNSTDKQTIVLEPSVVSKREFNRAIRKFRIDDSSIQLKGSKNAEQIRQEDKKIKSNQDLLELYRPKNCHCDCGDTKDSSLFISEPTK